ncbi:hypothetical protein [Sphingomonas aquatilis]
MPRELLLAVADRQFVNDGSARWTVEHALKVLDANGGRAIVIDTLRTLRAAASPVPSDWLCDRLTVLWTHFSISRSHADPEALAVWLAENMRLLGDLPHDLVAMAIDRAVQTSRHGFIPSIGEIRVHAESATIERNHLIGRLERVAEAVGR